MDYELTQEKNKEKFQSYCHIKGTVIVTVVAQILLIKFFVRWTRAQSIAQPDIVASI